MLFTIKLFILVLIQLNLFYISGLLLLASRKETGILTIGNTFAAGFAFYHCSFWLIAYPWGLLDYSFSGLVVFWSAILIASILFSVIKNRILLCRQYIYFFRTFLRYPVYFVVCIAFVILILVIATRNGYWDIDSQTYIGEVTTILGTGHLLKFNPATGLSLSRQLFLHRGCSMFGAESAFWCRVFSVHPLVYCRIIRAAINPILLLIGSYTFVRTIGFSLESALQFIILACPAFLLFDSSGYTNTRFLLHRGYEGKAYLSGTLIVFTVLLCILYIRSVNTFAFMLLLMNEFATLSVSATALYIIPPLVIALLGAFIIANRKWRSILFLLILLIPNTVFALLQLIG